jgi:RNA-binding protein YhbY
MFGTLADSSNAAPIQHIGKLLVLWRPMPEKDKASAKTACRARRSSRS